MEKADLVKFDSWFKGYTEEYLDSQGDSDKQAVSFKLRHTQRVRELILRLGQSNGLEGGRLVLAEAIALFHDIGRFPQWAMWRTFNDSVSADHGQFGTAILRDSGLLEGLDPEEQNLILVSVGNHNAKSLPASLTEDETFFLKLVRDAEKLDIFQVHASYEPGKDPFLDKMMKGDLPNSPAVSEEIVDQLLAGRIPSKRHVKTQNDIRLIVLGWVFDLSFSLCHQIVIENSIVDTLYKALPTSQKIHALKNQMIEHLKLRAADHFAMSPEPVLQG